MDVVDQEWWEREMSFIVDDLSRSHPSFSADRIRAEVDAAAASLVPQASVRAYLPILVQRRARARLDAHQRSSPPPRA